MVSLFWFRQRGAGKTQKNLKMSNLIFWPFWGVKIVRIKKILFDKLLLSKSFGRQCGLIFLIRTLGSWFFAKNGYFRPVFQKRLNRFDLKAWVGGFWTWYHQHTYRGCQKHVLGVRGGQGGARKLIFRQKYPFLTILGGKNCPNQKKFIW